MHSHHSSKKVCKLRVPCNRAFDSATDGLLLQQLKLTLMIYFVKMLVRKKNFQLLLESRGIKKVKGVLVRYRSGIFWVLEVLYFGTEFKIENSSFDIQADDLLCLK